jgi:large subunit ribosomal protein L25
MALTLIGKKREPASKGRLGKLRREKLVPGMVYGRGRENTPISLDGHELSRIFNHIGSPAVFSLQIEGEKSPVMVLVKELQKNPLSQELTHVDFMQIQMNEPIHSLVSVHWSGEEELVKKGAVLQIMSREIP